MNYLLANRNCAATLELCTLHSMITISKVGDVEKGSNYLLQFGAWDFLIKYKIGKVSYKGSWKDPQSENVLQTEVMWNSLFCVTSLPPTKGHQGPLF